MSGEKSVPRQQVEVRISPVVALTIIAGDGCRSFTGTSTCRTAGSGRHPLARYGADAWCEACLCAAALEETR